MPIAILHEYDYIIEWNIHTLIKENCVAVFVIEGNAKGYLLYRKIQSNDIE